MLHSQWLKERPHQVLVFELLGLDIKLKQFLRESRMKEVTKELFRFDIQLLIYH